MSNVFKQNTRSVCSEYVGNSVELTVDTGVREKLKVKNDAKVTSSGGKRAA